ncbi:putative non-specific serine/threonine protein kinase [Helianthus annuus]|nr:putative non-specific serine/threonine protein kinase [Helianthus annuus]KAJ0617877.1 putative non-specific serine/threonine protein kinase [Helianthus annuus]
METNFLVIFTLLFLQRFGLGNNMLMTSSNVTCTERERQSLLAIKHSLKDRYNLLSTWTGVECCDWHGVGCDGRNGHVVKLDLRSQVSLETFQDRKLLEGVLSPSIQNLKHLNYLDLSMNYFSGNIPEFLGSFRHLEYLNLSATFSGGRVVPHHLGNLSRLQYLDLSYLVHLDTDYFIQFGRAPILDDLRWVSSLSSLRYLDLSGISIGKHIDWLHPINMLPSLLTLNLVSSDITNIPSAKFINFTSLKSFDLSSNDINSTIPFWLSNLTGLMHLNLGWNNFHGEIPDLLCNLSSLVHLDLFFNQLNGNIPECLGQLSKLKNLYLSGNSLVGVLSATHFTKLRNLNNLVLSGNSLVLNFSSQWIPPFQLQRFEASFCNTGPRFPNWLHTQTHIQRLHLSNSSIRDTIPEWFENIMSHIVELDLSNNQIRGKLPRFHFNSGDYISDFYGTLKLNSNKFEGSLATFPSNVVVLDLSDNLLSGHVPQTNGTMNPNLQIVNLSKNRFTGSIPVYLCKIPSIGILDLSQNKFSGRLPRCLGNLTGLEVMDVSDNTIAGVVPSSLDSLTQIWSLHLHNNRFEGNLPLSLQKLTRLLILDAGNNFLTGRIPFWIGESLLNLRILNFQSNKFTGKIPLQLCQLNALHHLNLAQNNITGTIPRCFSNLRGMITYQAVSPLESNYYYQENILAYNKGTQLEYTKTLWFLVTLDLSSNNITGEIPDVLMNLVGLRNLNLSRNQLKGQIPRMIGHLSKLESLDLSMNMLSGQIPQSLSSLNFLSCLNVSFNNLSGAIPVGNQLQTLEEPSIYEGNDGLCGPSISRSCQGNSSSYNHVGEDEGQDDDQGLWFYFGMGSGFVVGFVGLLGSLHFIRRWRVAYFEMLEMLTVLILVNVARIRRTFFK